MHVQIVDNKITDYINFADTTRLAERVWRVQLSCVGHEQRLGDVGSSY
jgi:hypothetical protein